MHFFSLHLSSTSEVPWYVLHCNFKHRGPIEVWLVALERYGSLVNIPNDIFRKKYFLTFVFRARIKYTKHKTIMILVRGRYVNSINFLVSQIVKIISNRKKNLIFEGFRSRAFKRDAVCKKWIILKLFTSSSNIATNHEI